MALQRGSNGGGIENKGDGEGSRVVGSGLTQYWSDRNDRKQDPKNLCKRQVN